MPLRASKMNGFILGFQRFVWCPKWTPDSNNSFTPMLNTISLWLKIRPALRRRTIPRNTGLSLMLLWPFHTHTSAEIKAVLPPPFPAKWLPRISNKHAVAIVIFNLDERAHLNFWTTENGVSRRDPVSAGKIARRLNAGV